jgi:hypothetical protein
MANLAPPRTQYNRNLTFRLVGGGSPVVFTFPIKPGELELTTPARVTTTGTLQGVYQDFGGIGVRTLRIQGHTGWRRKVNGADNSGMDGFECFQMLYKSIYREYHRRIVAAPNVDDIKLMLIDDLFDFTYVVSMDDFQASKSSSKSLLYNYVIPMTIQELGTNGRDGSDLEGLRSVAMDANNIPIALREVLNSAAQLGQKEYRHYVVQRGDSLQSISYMYFGTRSKDTTIAALNHIVLGAVIEYGTILKIPW